jgi:hypothetical protein
MAKISSLELALVEELQKRFKGSDAKRFRESVTNIEARIKKKSEANRQILLQIAELANVPGKNRALFCKAIAEQLAEILLDCTYQGIGLPAKYDGATLLRDHKLLVKAEHAIRIAKKALLSLSVGHRRVLGMSIVAQLWNRGLFDSVSATNSSQLARIIFDWPDMLDAIGATLTKATGKNPYQKSTGGRGRPRGGRW